jgi:hypothetical protein
MNLDQYNAKLTRLRLRIKGNRLYIRGTLPPKPQDGILPKQYDLSTGLNTTPDGLRIAFSRAQEIEARLALDKFNWQDYLGDGILGTKPIKTWVAEFEANYWHTHTRTPNREIGYYNAYGRYLQQLPQDEPLSEAVILPFILATPPNTAIRNQSYFVYSGLFKFAGIAHNLKRYKTPYKPNITRELPSDDEVIDMVDAVPIEWRWTFAILATYGLRTHEIRLLDCSKIKEPPHIVYVNEDSKTGARAVYPVPPSWVERWELWNVNKPKITNHQNANSIYGNKLAAKVRYVGESTFNSKFSSYYFRDAYAVRCSLLGVDAVIASKWMGHTLQIHWKSYLKFFDENHHLQVWTELKKRESDSLQPDPPTPIK